MKLRNHERPNRQIQISQYKELIQKVKRKKDQQINRAKDIDSSQKRQYKWLTHNMRNVNENFTEIPFPSYVVIGKE